MSPRKAMNPGTSPAKEASPTARRLTLQNLLAEGAEIWVRNRSGEVSGKTAGHIVMQVGSGVYIDKVVVPPGHDPVCLTDQVTPKLLNECMDLFKLTKSGVLEILDPQYAEDYYEKNAERKKIVDSKIDSILSNKREDGPDPKNRTISSANIQVNAAIGDICLRSKHSNITEREALERLFEQDSVLTADDYNYIMANGIFDGVKKWAKDQLIAKFGL